MLEITTAQAIADRLTFSPLIWFSASGSGPAIKPVTAAFISYEEAAAWAARHPGQTVHFPGGNQLQAFYALADGLAEFTRRCTEGLAAQDAAATRRVEPSADDCQRAEGFPCGAG